MYFFIIKHQKYLSENINGSTQAQVRLKNLASHKMEPNQVQLEATSEKLIKMYSLVGFEENYPLYSRHLKPRSPNFARPQNPY